MHMNVPGVGKCYYRWIHKKKEDTLRVWLPQKYILPHELDGDQLDALAWKAASLFSKRFHLGVGILQLSSESYAFLATPAQERFFMEHGPVKMDTVTGGIAEIDNSEGEVEQEYSSRSEARVVASDLGIPGQMVIVERKTDDIKEWTRVFQDNFTAFLKADHELKEQNKKQWVEQHKFNEEVHQFMVAQSEFNQRTAATLMESHMRMLGQRQTKIDQFGETGTEYIQ
jgi:hypothetical protein